MRRGCPLQHPPVKVRPARPTGGHLTKPTRPVTHVLGCHVEMTSQPGRAYPIGCTCQPDERSLEMTTAQLAAIRDAAAPVASKRGVHKFDDFIIYNEPRKNDLLKLLARGYAHKIRTSHSGL